MREVGNRVQAYVWQHAGREHAELLLEEDFPCRIYFTLFDEDGSVLYESGWHGYHSTKKYTVARAQTKSKFRPRNHIPFELGDTILTLDGFRYIGMESDWTHNNLQLMRRVDSDEFRFISCDCGTRHPVTMHLLVGPVRIPRDHRPGPPTVLGCSTR